MTDSDLAARLGHRFRDASLLETALTHSSFAHEREGVESNERLEFLGDAILGLVVAEQLFAAHPDWPEGELTRARAGLVNREALAECAKTLALPDAIRLGRTERRSAGEQKDSILADCFEAVLGALYLDGGIDPVSRVVRQSFGDALTAGARRAQRDPKTEFQEWAHAARGETPRYRTVDDSETDDDDRRFTVEVTLDGQPCGRGVGRTKRAAERAAAREALAKAGSEA